MRRGDGGAVAAGASDLAEGPGGGAGIDAARHLDAEIGIDRMLARHRRLAAREGGEGVFDSSDRLAVELEQPLIGRLRGFAADHLDVRDVADARSLVRRAHRNELPESRSGRPRCAATDWPISAKLSRRPTGPGAMPGPKASTGTYSRV